MTMNLLLIRHGSTDWADKRLSGWMPGIHLNDAGRQQVEALPRRLAGVPIAAIYASPLERAVETARPLADARGLPIQVRHGLIESGCGEWAGRTMDELQDEELLTVIRAYPSSVRFPGGESFPETQARIVAELDAIRAAHPGQTVVAVSHADPIKLAVAHYAGLPLDLYHRLAISPASITGFSFHRFGPRLLFLNHTEALPPLPADADAAAGGPKPKEG